MRKFIFTIMLLCTSAISAQAQEQRYTGGMKYTTMSQKPASDVNPNTLYNRKELITETSAPAKDALPKIDNEQAAEAQKKPEESVWDKYKELAAGTAKDKDNKPTAPEKPASPSAEEKTQAPQNATGIAAIIQDYQKNKQKRSQMKSLRFKKPEPPQVEMPSVEKDS